MFGLAARRRHLCIETRARNAVSLLFPDASGYRPARAAIMPGGPTALRGDAPFARLLRRAAGPSASRRACRATPAAICVITPIGVPWSRRTVAGRSFNSSIFRRSRSNRGRCGGADAERRP